MQLRKFTTAFAMAFAVSTLAACSGDLLGHNQGRVRVFLSGNASTSASANLAEAAAASATAGSDDLFRRDDDDDDDDDDERPSRWFHAANVTLSSILVRSLDGVLVNLVMPVPVTVDVVEIESGKTIQLPDGTLPVGLYDQVVIVITAVQGVMHDGTVITIQPPGGGWTSIVPICPLDVIEGGTTTIGIDLMVRNAFHWGDNRFHFQPRFRAASECPE